MPIKHNLTKYDLLKDRIHKTTAKEETDYTEEDKILRNIAVIVAAFSSNHSWKTYAEMTENISPNFNCPEVKGEYFEASAQKWKGITAQDISEVAKRGIQGLKFERWLYYTVENPDRESYKRAWSTFNEFIDKDVSLEEPSGIK